MPHLLSNLTGLALLATLGGAWELSRGQDSAPVQNEPADVPSAADAPAVVPTGEEAPADMPEMEDESDESGTIPSAFPEDRYVTMWDKNPFMRKIIVIEQARESFAKDWALSGISASGGVYTVRIFNKQTGKFERIKQGEQNGEFKLVTVNYDKDRSKSSVEISRGSEVAKLTYDDSLMSRPVTIQTNMGAPGQVPGNPNAQAMPMNPNLPGAQASLQRGPDGRPMIGGAAASAAAAAAALARPGLPGSSPTRVGAPTAAFGSPTTGAPVTIPNAGNLPGMPTTNYPTNPGYAAPGTDANPPISRRRQLIPAPIQQNQ